MFYPTSLSWNSPPLFPKPRDVTNFTVGGFAPMSPRISSPMHPGGGGKCFHVTNRVAPHSGWRSGFLIKRLQVQILQEDFIMHLNTCKCQHIKLFSFGLSGCLLNLFDISSFYILNWALSVVFWSSLQVSSTEEEAEEVVAWVEAVDDETMIWLGRLSVYPRDRTKVKLFETNILWNIICFGLVFCYIMQWNV